VFAGEVDEDELPLAYALGEVFAMPCRDRLAGLEVEGWGIVFVEAAACGIPVVAGASGGAPEAVLDGRTGVVVDGADVSRVAESLTELLIDRTRAEAMGRAGRERIEAELSWDRVRDRLGAWLGHAALTGPGGRPG
jgi:phosphatidylinositol alpha-1,6-mannosyltransferase